MEEVAGGVRTVPERLTLDPATSTACDWDDLIAKPTDDDDNDGYYNDDDGNDCNDSAT